MKKIAVVALVATLSMLTACAESETSDDCEWERKPISRSAHKPGDPKGMMLDGFEGKVGGSSGGRGSSGGSGSRGGSSGGGSKPNMQKGSSGGSGGAARPRYNKSNPAPKPSSPAGSGMKWSWDCD